MTFAFLPDPGARLLPDYNSTAGCPALLAAWKGLVGHFSCLEGGVARGKEHGEASQVRYWLTGEIVVKLLAFFEM